MKRVSISYNGDAPLILNFPGKESRKVGEMFFTKRHDRLLEQGFAWEEVDGEIIYTRGDQYNSILIEDIPDAPKEAKA